MSWDEAMDAILELHRPARYISTESGCSVCRHYEPGMAGGPQPIPYPCPTVKVIRAELGQEQD